MSLSGQIVEQIRLLLDKPPSPLISRQITQLINKQIAPADQLLLLFASKCRADLLLLLLKTQLIPTSNIGVLLDSIRKDIIKYSKEDAEQIWKLVLEKEEVNQYRQEWGVTKIMNEAMRVTNQSSKERLLQLLSSNISVLWQLGDGTVVEMFVKTYCSNYIKYSIYLTSYPALATQCLLIDRSTKTQLISTALKTSLLQRTLSLLTATIQRQLYPFQNNCLALLAQLLSDKKQIIANSLDLRQCSKVLQMYLWKKPTREEARKMQLAVEQAEQRINKEEAGKMEYCREGKERQKSEVLLIENVIDKTNNYRQRQHLIINSSKASPSRSKSKQFLRKGNGYGGGKASLLTQKSPLKKANISSLQEMIQKCFNQKQENQERKSEISVPILQQQQSSDKKGQKYRGSKQESRSELSNKKERHIGMNKRGLQSELGNNKERMSGMSNKIQYNEAGIKNKGWFREQDRIKEVDCISNNQTVSVCNSVEQGEQWVQISNLIDLAYKYKFG